MAILALYKNKAAFSRVVAWTSFISALAGSVRHLMRTLYIFSLVVLISSCVGKQDSVYYPTDNDRRHEQRYKGVTNISYGVPLADGGAFGISAGSSDDKSIQIGLQIAINKGSMITIEKWQLILSSPELEEDIVVPIENMSLSIYGRAGVPGHREHINAGGIFFGRAVNESVDNVPVDAYITLVTIKHKPPKNLIVKLPKFYVNEKAVNLAPIGFELIKVKNSGYSMQ